jgi:hypothetical protein
LPHEERHCWRSRPSLWLVDALTAAVHDNCPGQSQTSEASGPFITRFGNKTAQRRVRSIPDLLRSDEDWSAGASISPLPDERSFKTPRQRTRPLLHRCYSLARATEGQPNSSFVAGPAVYSLQAGFDGVALALCMATAECWPMYCFNTHVRFCNAQKRTDELKSHLCWNSNSSVVGLKVWRFGDSQASEGGRRSSP